MREFKGTKGNWKLGDVEKNQHGALGINIDTEYEAVEGLATVWCWGDNEPAETDIATANLIAAAPELLEACQSFLTLFQESDMRPEDECHEVAYKMRQAINKALNLLEP